MQRGIVASPSLFLAGHDGSRRWELDNRQWMVHGERHMPSDKAAEQPQSRRRLPAGDDVHASSEEKPAGRPRSKEGQDWEHLGPVVAYLIQAFCEVLARRMIGPQVLALAFLFASKMDRTKSNQRTTVHRPQSSAVSPHPVKPRLVHCRHRLHRRCSPRAHRTSHVFQRRRSTWAWWWYTQK